MLGARLWGDEKGTVFVDGTCGPVVVSEGRSVTYSAAEALRTVGNVMLNSLDFALDAAGTVDPSGIVDGVHAAKGGKKH